MAHKIQIFQQGFQKKITLQAEKGDRVLFAVDVNPTMFSSSWTAPVARLRACHICKTFAAIDMSREGLWP